MKIAVLASLLAGAAAFAPAANTISQSTAINAYEKELGAQEPLGFWVSGDASLFKPTTGRRCSIVF